MTRSPPFVRLGPEICQDPTAAGVREWWLANGIGGYAGGTVSGALTRRYHGLLIAPFHPPLGRTLVFTKADAVLVDGHRETPLHTNHWGGGVVAPRGYAHIQGFHLDHGLPVWHLTVDGLELEQRIWMEHGENHTRVAFRWTGGERDTAPRLRLGLLAAWRDHHGSSQPGAFAIHGELTDDALRVHLPGERWLEIHGDGATFTTDHTWMENFSLDRERERGLDDRDTHLRVGAAELTLERDAWVGIGVALDAPGRGDLEASLAAALARREALHPPALPGIPAAVVPPCIRQLVDAADAYLVHLDGSGEAPRASVIAGYPWFGDWGRDTMIALPGLTLATGRPALARKVLLAFTGHVSEGMVPNRFPEAGSAPEYNTVDAALWFIEGWRTYFEATMDRATLNAVFPVLAGIVEAYRRGTRYGIAMDPADGLIRAGEPGQQLTWMDARVDGREVTPRHGKPVEVNALWFNALATLSTLARVLGRDGGDFASLARGTAAGFGRFRRPAGGLFDVIDGPAGHDDAIRPNQVLAVSLPFSPLDAAARQAVVTECRENLLTPFGLRSLAASHPRYRGRYEGGVAERDGGYHQGPVWAWLLGHFARAEYRTSGDGDTAKARLALMAGHLFEAGLGHIGEIFDGDPPHAPRGAPAQAWSVACTLEAWWRLHRAQTSRRTTPPSCPTTRPPGYETPKGRDFKVSGTVSAGAEKSGNGS
ncbi:MAG: amylo-alpha-1,6-glucosidase [Gammaproteobacteria bacterium]|nr:amylo-alpha-1,6-glucosidase [Gammaproteobacteria bacterium]